MINLLSKIVILTALICSANIAVPGPAAHASNAHGVKIGQVIVGRSGHEVQFSIMGNVPATPCANTHSSGLRYMFSLNRADGEALLSTILTAKTAGMTLTIVGTNSCNDADNVEFISYLWLV